MHVRSVLPHAALTLALAGLTLACGCVEDRGAAGDYCRANSQCDDGLICVELSCRDPFTPLPEADYGPADDDMFVPPDVDMGPEADMGPETDMGPPEADMGPPEEDMGPDEEDMGPPDMGADEDMGG